MKFHFLADTESRALRIRAAYFAASAAAVLLSAPPFATSNAQAAAASSADHNIAGIYWTTTYSPTVQPTGGGDLPYKPKAMATYKKNMAAVKTNALEDNARKFCNPDGVPRILATPYPFEIVQPANSANEIYMIHELNHSVRRIALNKPIPPKDELLAFPFFNGHSVGHWDGDTLVVQTVGFNEKTFLDNSGAPHTDQLTTVERIRKINDGKELEDVVTVHDPGVFTKDWSARFVYEKRPDVKMMDFNCGEKHRDISAVKGVHTNG